MRLRYKMIFGFSFLALSVISFLLSYNSNFTGGVIGTNANPPLLYLASMVFIVASLFIFASKQTLDAIMIPTGGYEENSKRTKKALEEYDFGRGARYVLISGGTPSQDYQIYRKLRQAGVERKKIKLEGKSNSTLDNVLYSLETLKESGVKDLGIASSRSHLNRFEKIINRAKREGIIGGDFRVHRLEIPQSESAGKKLYEFIADLAYRYKLSKGLKYAQSHQSKKLFRRIRDKFVYREKPKNK
jgi:uncharacterized SAM-binding protein YcdF (DUF218 family)